MKHIFLLQILCVLILQSQDFGYEYYVLSEYRAIGGSYNKQDFSSASSNTLADSSQIKFSTQLPFIEYRQNNARISVGFQTYQDQQGKKRESFSAYAESHNDFPLSVKRQTGSSFYIPLIVSANYVRAESGDSSVKNFDVGSLGLGTGIKFKYLDRSIGVQIYAGGAFHFASEGFSTEYGSQTSFFAEAQCVVPQILLEGILFGYRFESQQWNMSSTTLDYRRKYHGVFVGIMF